MSERAKVAHYGTELENRLAKGAQALLGCTLRPDGEGRSRLIQHNETLVDGRVVPGSILKVSTTTFNLNLLCTSR